MTARGKKAAIADKDKPRLSLIPKEALWETGKALTFGAYKYSTWNYRDGIEILYLLDAAQRHIAQFINGEDYDSESGVCHLGSGMSNLAMATWMFYNRPDMDNRYKGKTKNAPSSKKTKSKRKTTNKK
jgi:hypothetical protein